MDQDEETRRVEELEAMIKLADIIEREKSEKNMGISVIGSRISVIGSIKLGFGLAFGF